MVNKFDIIESELGAALEHANKTRYFCVAKNIQLASEYLAQLRREMLVLAKMIEICDFHTPGFSTYAREKAEMELKGETK